MRADGATLAIRLANEISRQLDINAKLGEGLLRELDRTHKEGRPVFDAEGNVVATSFTPDRDWARCYGHYRNVNRDLLTEERERTKLRLLLDKDGGHRVLTDEEFAAEMKQLALEAVRTMPPEELARELSARGVSVPVTEDDSRDDDS